MHAPLKNLRHRQPRANTKCSDDRCGGVISLWLFFVSLSPGLCPDWEDWNPKNAKKNAKEAMDNAEKWLDIPQV